MYDVAVVGAGPAGLSAGIALRESGARVVVMERATRPACGPGETLHPGIEVVFDQLGVGEEIREKSLQRHKGFMVDHAGLQTFHSYGEDWRGFQVRKRDLTQVFCDRYCALGGELFLSSSATKYENADGQIQVHTATNKICAGWLIDATGGAGWLDRQQGVHMIDYSPRIWLHYGYTKIVPRLPFPSLSIQSDYWLWRAPLDDVQVAWVEGRMSRIRSVRSGTKIMDGTWKASARPAYKRAFRIGDAACRLDPRNGHGVMRALMSGKMVAHLIGGVEDLKLSAEEAAESYNKWLQVWFKHDVQQLRKL